MAIKTKKAWAVVDKQKPTIRINDIFDSKDIQISKSEKIIQIEIKEI